MKVVLLKSDYMKNKINSILLIDDEISTNYIHKRIIEKLNICNEIIVYANPYDALTFLNDETQISPNIIFLDINMPGMDGWEFLEEYEKKEVENQNTILVMLTTSNNPDDKLRAQHLDAVKEYLSKPLKPEDLNFLFKKYFN